MPRTIPEDWYPGAIPDNAVLDPTVHIETSQCFERCLSEVPDAVRIGRGSSVYLPTMFDLGPRARVTVGEFTMLNGPRIICDSAVSIGDHVLIAWNVVLMDTHRLPADPVRRRAALIALGNAPAPGRVPLNTGEGARPIRIGNNAWIGFDSVVLPGVTIGDEAVVGARSVVVADVPARCIVAGNPARVIRRL